MVDDVTMNVFETLLLPSEAVNVGDSDVTETIELDIDGSIVDSQDVTLDKLTGSDNDERVTLEWTPGRPYAGSTVTATVKSTDDSDSLQVTIDSNPLIVDDFESGLGLWTEYTSGALPAPETWETRPNAAVGSSSAVLEGEGDESAIVYTTNNVAANSQYRFYFYLPSGTASGGSLSVTENINQDFAITVSVNNNDDTVNSETPSGLQTISSINRDTWYELNITNINYSNATADFQLINNSTGNTVATQTGLGIQGGTQNPKYVHIQDDIIDGNGVLWDHITTKP